MAYLPSNDLIPRIEATETAAIGRLMSRAESGAVEAREALARIHRRAGQAHVIGVTGVPGSGKSTLVSRLAERLRTDGGKIGIVAIDPSSPYSGGSIMGDRIRMSNLGTDPGIYIRSMATRGATGGMARATLEAVDILDVAGFRTIIIETVGVGQHEVEIACASHTTIVVSAPGLGDEIQAIKAGMLEIADIHVVSKCDRSDANRTLTDLKHMLMLGMRDQQRPEWVTPVIGTSSVSGQGLEDLATAITRHREVAFGPDSGRARLKMIAEFRLRKTAENLLFDRFRNISSAVLEPLAECLVRREGDPYLLAEQLLEASLGEKAAP